MDVTVSGRHIEITPAIREYASGKVAKLPRYFDRLQSVDVVTDKTDHPSYEVEIIAKVDRIDPFVAKVEGQDLYACIDDAVAKLERRLSDHKGRLHNRKRMTG